MQAPPGFVDAPTLVGALPQNGAESRQTDQLPCGYVFRGSRKTVSAYDLQMLAHAGRPEWKMLSRVAECRDLRRARSGGVLPRTTALNLPGGYLPL